MENEKKVWTLGEAIDYFLGSPYYNGLYAGGSENCKKELNERKFVPLEVIREKLEGIKTQGGFLVNEDIDKLLKELENE